MASIEDFPEVIPFLDNSDDYVNTVTEANLNGSRLLIVTQAGEIDGGQAVFAGTVKTGSSSIPTRFVELTGNERNAVLVGPRISVLEEFRRGSSRTVHEHMVDSVDVFSSATGPDGGNLACVWAVRHIVHQALGRWITRTDATADLRRRTAELLRLDMAGTGHARRRHHHLTDSDKA